MERFRYFVECSGCLLLVEVDILTGSVVHVLELERDQYSEGWVIKYCVKLGRIGVTCGHSILSVVGVEQEDGVALVMWGQQGSVLSCNLKNRTWRVLNHLMPRNSTEWCPLCFSKPSSLVEKHAPISAYFLSTPKSKPAIPYQIGSWEFGLNLLPVSIRAITETCSKLRSGQWSILHKYDG
ncbi:hypothetical protein NC651_015478 [Populus alba x Populus x berolinensis]|nr:hypothetical protein NC651_015478 [Populus alba x Populus x berolinensis]